MDYEVTNDVLTFIILPLLMGFGILVVAVLLRLWNTLDTVRHTCRMFNEESEFQKKSAIEMCESGERVDVIARDLKVRDACVCEWCLEVLEKRAVADFESGLDVSQIACTAIGFLDHSLNQDCDIIQSH